MWASVNKTLVYSNENGNNYFQVIKVVHVYFKKKKHSAHLGRNNNEKLP